MQETCLERTYRWKMSVNSRLKAIYSRVPNNRAYTIFFFGKISPLYDPYQVWHDYCFWTKFLQCSFILHCTITYYEHFFPTCTIKVKKKSMMYTGHYSMIRMNFLIFEFTKTFKLSLTACCVVLKVSAYFHILTFHNGEE